MMSISCCSQHLLGKVHLYLPSDLDQIASLQSIDGDAHALAEPGCNKSHAKQGATGHAQSTVAQREVHLLVDIHHEMAPPVLRPGAQCRGLPSSTVVICAGQLR